MKSFENDASDTLSAVPSVPIETRLNRLRKDGRDLNAVVQVLDARARRAADRPNATASGAGRTGALSNLTYGVKDLIAVGGVVTGMGIQQMGRKVAPDDAAVVKLVDEAGGILTATLAMTALAGVGRPEPPGCSVTGITRNPWDRRRWAGGSSGGPAAVVAADLIDFALGSESGGSIIVPSAWCGVTGLRPTLGAVPSRGVEILSPTMDKVGVIARTADLCLSVFECLVAGSHGSHPPQDLKTVGVVAVGDEWSTEVRRVFEGAFAAVNETFDTRRLDHRPGNSLHLEAANSLMSVESAHTLRDLITDESVEFPDPGQRGHLLTALAEPASVRDRALAVRDRAIMEWESLFEDVDAVVTLASRNVAPILESQRPPEGESGRILKSANLAGLPGVAFPCGFSRSGLPVGLHVIGPPGSDSALLKAVARFQAAHPFHQSLPPMPS